MKAKKCRSRLSTIQQSYDGHMAEMLSELDELERLARIGKATEKAFKKIEGAMFVSYWREDEENYVKFDFYCVEELLKWEEKEEK